MTSTETTPLNKRRRTDPKHDSDPSAVAKKDALPCQDEEEETVKNGPRQPKNVGTNTTTASSSNTILLQGHPHGGGGGPPPPPPPLPPGWLAAMDSVSGRVYFANPTTGETQWNPPVNANNTETPPPNSKRPHTPDPEHDLDPSAAKEHVLPCQDDEDEEEEIVKNEPQQLRNNSADTNTTTTTDDASMTRNASNTTDNRQGQHETCCNTSTIYIGGLHPRIAQVHLEKLCKPYGTIQRLQLCSSSRQSSRSSFCFCEYHSVNEARAAIQALHGKVLLQKTLIVRPAHHDKPGSCRRRRRRISDNYDNNTTTTSLAIDSKIAQVKRKLEKLQQGEQKY